MNREGIKMEQEIIKLLDKKKNTSLTSIEINDYLGFNGVNEDRDY